MDLGYQINACARAFKYGLNTALSPVDLTAAQYAVLKAIEAYEIEGVQVTAVQISKRLDLDKPTISGIIQRLIAKQYIVKEKHPKDQRAFLLTLSSLGKETIKDLDEVSADLVERATQGLSDQEILILRNCLAHLTQNLNEGGM